MGRILATLNPAACDSSLTLSQGGLVVTTNTVCDFHRAVFGTLALGAGYVGFETYFYSTSNPSGGLANLCSVGIATPDSLTSKYVGEQTTSVGLRPSDGAGAAGIYKNNVLQLALDEIDERTCIGVLLRNDPTAPLVSFHANGNFLGQVALPTGQFWLPGVSIGSDTPGDVSAYCNFGQYALDHPVMFLNL